jgi:hypothetical protein
MKYITMTVDVLFHSNNIITIILEIEHSQLSLFH